MRKIIYKGFGGLGSVENLAVSRVIGSKTQTTLSNTDISRMERPLCQSIIEIRLVFALSQ
jgi:hypothetical protein